MFEPFHNIQIRDVLAMVLLAAIPVFDQPLVHLGISAPCRIIARLRASPASLPSRLFWHLWMSVLCRRSAERTVRKITDVVCPEQPEKTQLTSIRGGRDAPEVHRDRAPALRPVRLHHNPVCTVILRRKYPQMLPSSHTNATGVFSEASRYIYIIVCCFLSLAAPCRSRMRQKTGERQRSGVGSIWIKILRTTSKRRR